MNKQEKIDALCEYVLDSNHERDHVIEDIIFGIDDKWKKSEIKESMIKNSTWYIANELYYGKRQAKSNLEKAYQEAVQIRKGRTIRRKSKDVK